VMGLDDRLKVAVPVYGCGFLDENSVWLPTFEKLQSQWRKEWVKNFDPSRYAGQAKMPVLFVNGTNDFAYPLDSYQKTYRLVKDRTLCVTVNMPHGHQQGWAPIEIGLFVDQHLKNGKPLIKLGRVLMTGPTDQLFRVALFIEPESTAVKMVQLHWTTDTKEVWQKRKWQSRELKLSRVDTTEYYGVDLPLERPLIYFLTATDERGATVSTEHVTLEK